VVGVVGMTPAALLVAWLASAVLTFAPGPRRDAAREAQAEAAARVSLAMAFRSGEPGVYWGPSARARTALLLVAIGSQESAFLPRIQAGDCRRGECDGALGADGRYHAAAACWLQIHADDGGGIALLGDGGWVYASALRQRSEPADQDRAYSNADLLADPGACMLVGLHMVRRSMRAGGRLCMYTGEIGPCPKADWRQHLADGWFARRPPPVTDEEVERR
jgi:hypothetical protein